ncbi:MAG: spore cortex biosynthesis protein YabQ [Oscillospiraceae bacterium]|nr:spore cortex biosynthesis protein YabQ [Oscillospiraceae bacterium]
MYNPISQNLYELMMFAILGFALGVLYEPLRISRLFIKTGAITAGIQDFLFLSLCGVTVFAYSLEFGEGYFRYYYLIGIAFGAAVYFQTAGRLISFITKTFANAIKAAAKYIARSTYRILIKPLWNLLIKFAQKLNANFVKINKITKKHSIDLKNAVKIRYNSTQLKKRKNKGAKSQAVRQVTRKVRENQNETKIKARVIRSTSQKSTQKP